MKKIMLVIVFSLIAVANASAVEMPIGCAVTKLSPEHGMPYFDQNQLKKIGRLYQGVIQTRKCRVSDIQGELRGAELFYEDQCKNNSGSPNCQKALRMQEKYTDIINNLN